MKHPLSLYDFSNNNIRVIEIDGEPWFVSKDVCDALDIKRYRNALDVTVSEPNRVAVMKSSLLITHTMGLSFPNRGMVCINEAGLYELIFSSRKPEALTFKNWVTSVVLPAINKHGGYIAGEEKVATGEMDEDELVMRAIEVQRRKVERLRAEKQSMRKVLETCSMQRYCGLNDISLTPSERSRLSSLAGRMARKEGIVLQKEDRVFFFSGMQIPTKVNLYPRDLLDRAAALLGVFEVRGQQPLSLH